MPYALVPFICYLPIFLAELLTRHGQACLWALRGEAAMSPVADRDGSRMAFNLNLLTDVLAQLLYVCMYILITWPEQGCLPCAGMYEFL